MPRRRLAALLVVLVLGAYFAHGQARDSNTLSEAEVEQLRDSAYVPADRVSVFLKLLDARVKTIQDLITKPRRPGREEDLHDLLEQFTAISDELNDNLDDYDTRHRDIRKPLPKLLDASERWASSLRSIPDNETYNLSRKLALQSIRDTRESTNQADRKRSVPTSSPTPKPPKPNSNAKIPARRPAPAFTDTALQPQRVNLAGECSPS